MRNSMLVITLLVCIAPFARAQTPQPCFAVDGQPSDPAGCGAPRAARPASDPFARYLYPPEIVMAHQEAIGLTEKQRSAIQDLVKDLQSKVVDVQFKLASAGEKLARTLSAPVVDEASVLQQIDQVLASEREVKRAQVTLLVRIKNQLTVAQQGTLDKLR